MKRNIKWIYVSSLHKEFPFDNNVECFLTQHSFTIVVSNLCVYRYDHKVDREHKYETFLRLYRKYLQLSDYWQYKQDTYIPETRFI